MKRVFYKERLVTAAGYQITRYREQNGLTQEELSELLGYDHSYVSHVELGTMDLTIHFVKRMKWHCDVELTNYLPKSAQVKPISQLAELTYDIVAIEKISLQELAMLLSVHYKFVTGILFLSKTRTTRAVKKFIRLLKETFPEYATQIEISLSVS